MTPEQDEWDGVFSPEQEALHEEIEANTDALLADALRPLTTPTHGMVPGSHERPGGPTCLCGGPWLYWSDRCRWWKTNDEAADAREQS